MATKPLEDASFWIPSKFLPNDDVLMGSVNNDFELGPEFGLSSEFMLGPEFGPSQGGFPSDFPYEIDSPVESVVSSTETAESSEEEDFLAELTRRLTRSSVPEPPSLKSAGPCFSRSRPEKWVAAGSPKSILTGIGGWPLNYSGVSRNGSPTAVSQGPSPPTTPFAVDNDLNWDLVYAAAGRIARLRLNGEDAKYRAHQKIRAAERPYPTKTCSHVAVAKNSNSGFYSQTNQYNQAREDQILKQCAQPQVWGRTMKVNWSPQQQSQRNRGIGYENNSGRGGRPLGLPQSAWPALQTAQTQTTTPTRQTHGSNMRAVFLNGSGGAKRECAGTGVFLPRRYDNPTDSRKKSGCSTVLLPAKVVQALNLNLDDMSGPTQPRFKEAFPVDRDTLVARRNAILAQQKRSLRPEEIRLPQEWTY